MNHTWLRRLAAVWMGILQVSPLGCTVSVSDAGGGGRGGSNPLVPGDAGADEGAGDMSSNGQSGAEELSLSASRRIPGQFLTVSHASIAQGSEVEVTFSGAGGYEVSVEVAASGPGTAEVVVPPFTDLQTGQMTQGDVTVSVSGVASSASLTIEDLPRLEGLPPGAGVIALFKAAREGFSDAQVLLDAVTAEVGGAEDTAAAAAGIADQMALIDEIITEIEETGQLVLETDGADPVILTAEALALADRIVLGQLGGLQEKLGLAPTLLKADIRMQGDQPPPDAVLTDALRAIRDTAVPAGEAFVVTLATGAGLFAFLVGGLTIGQIALVGGVAILAVGGGYLIFTSVATESSLSALAGREPDLARDSQLARGVAIRTGQNLATTVLPATLPGRIQRAAEAVIILDNVNSIEDRLADAVCRSDQEDRSQESLPRMQSSGDLNEADPEIVSIDEFCSAIGRPIDPEPEEEPDADRGACCRVGGCTRDTSENCAAIGGIFQGSGTLCSDDTCPTDTVACCQGSNSCREDYTAEVCDSICGVPYPPGVTCDEVVCNNPSLPCCIPPGVSDQHPVGGCGWYSAGCCIRNGGTPCPECEGCSGCGLGL